MGAYINDFISVYVPTLWESEIAMFGRTVDYWLDNDPATSQSLVVIWIEGSEDEEMSPGRYSRAKIRNADLARQPLRGDVVVKDGIEYDVVRVDASAYQTCSIVLQDRTA